MSDYRVYYGIPTYSEFHRAKDAIEHILTTSTLVPNEFVVIDNSEKGLALPVLQPLLDSNARINVIPRVTNILAGAWNDIMNLYPEDYIIIANDDVKPDPGSIEALVNLARNNPDIAMVNGSGHSGNSYSYFLLKKWAYAKVGPFDERFLGAYFEDNDYDHRLRVLMGLIREEEPLATFDHYGSATLRNMSEDRKVRHHIAFARNEDYFLRKWGGKPGKERYTVPFQENINIDD